MTQFSSSVTSHILTGTIEVEFLAFSTLANSVGESVRSPNIPLGDTIWSLKIYPGADIAASKGHVSCFLTNEGMQDLKTVFQISTVQSAITGKTSGESTNTFKSGHSWGYTTFATTEVIKSVLINDTLKLRVTLSVHMPPEQRAYAGMLELFDAQSLAPDVWFVVRSPVLSSIAEEGTSIGAHKFVLAARSSVFNAMLTGTMKEAQSNKITITDFSLLEVRAFVRLLYEDHFQRAQFATHAEALLAMADKYQVPTLMSACEKYLASTLAGTNAVALLKLADLHRAEELRRQALLFITQNAVACAEHMLDLTADLAAAVMRAFVGKV
jgi:speckle-type POZ protein